jgi:hypothetical protein
MKRFGQVTLALAVVLLAASPAFAQRGQRQGRGGFGGGMRGGFGMDMLSLANQKSVQEELKVSDEQATKIKDLAAKQRESFGSLKDLSREERRTKVAEQRKANDKAIAEVLKTDQVKRLKQITWQLQGTRAFRNEEVATALKLTDDQKGKIKTIQEDAFKSMRELFGKGQGAEGAKEKLAEVRKATQEKVMGVLTDEQKTAWKELVGTPFKGEIQRPQGRRGRRPAAEASRSRRSGRDGAALERRGGFSRREQVQN